MATFPDASTSTVYLGALPWDVLEDIVKHRQNWDVRSAAGRKGVRTVQGVRLQIRDARKPPQNTLVLDADELEAPLPGLRGERALYLAARGVASEAVLQAGKVHACAPRRAVVATLAEALEMAEHPVVILASSRPAADLVRNELRPGDAVRIGDPVSVRGEFTATVQAFELASGVPVRHACPVQQAVRVQTSHGNYYARQVRGALVQCAFNPLPGNAATTILLPGVQARHAKLADSRTTRLLVGVGRGFDHALEAEA